jgi:hypothetical protein
MVPFQIHRRIPLVRRPFHQRDEAIAERNALQSELAKLQLQVSKGSEPIAAGVPLSFLRHRSASRTTGQPAVTEAQAVDDESLVERIVMAYRAANSTPVGASDSFWLQTIMDEKRPIHEALMGGNTRIVGQILRNPATNMLFYGFDTLTSREANPADLGWRAWMQEWSYDNLLRLAEAVGARRLDYPEAPEAGPPPDPEAILECLDEALGFPVRFPNPFPDEVGLATSRGVASYRAVQALYQAWRIAELVGRRPTARVVEIGAGLGRTAFYARQFGLVDYTIIDLPISNVAQGYFLGRTVPPDAVRLFNELGSGLRVLPPVAFLNAQERYDIAVNVDSLTEMSPETARAYCSEIKSRADLFLSINHEYNSFTVRNISQDLQMRAASRTPYWLRRGYVDEVFELASAHASQAKPVSEC